MIRTEDLETLLNDLTLSTNPDLLFYMSYDSYDITNNKTPDDSISRFTINGLKHIFPLLKIESINYSIFVEDILLEGFTTIPNKNHIEYIKEIMLYIFRLYQEDEDKIPKKMYKWFFK